MKSNRIDYKRKDKILTGSVITSAALLLGLYFNNGTVVKADSLPAGTDTAQTANSATENSANQNKNSTSSEVINDTLAGSSNANNEKIGNSANQDENSKTGTGVISSTQTGATTPTTGKKAGQTPGKTRSLSLVNFVWNGLNVTFDYNTGVLVIPGGEITDPIPVNRDISGYDLKKIIINGKLKIKGSAKELFGGFQYLTSITGLNNLDTSEVTDMSYMFWGCSSLIKLDLSSFDTSNVENMSYMFEQCFSLTNLDLDVTKFDTSKVTDMSYMFWECGSLTSIDVSKFNTAKVSDMTFMFDDCSSLTSIDVSHWDTSNVEHMKNMFMTCLSLSSLNVSHWDTAKVKEMECMFSYCWALTELDLSSFDTSNVRSMGQMFFDCRNLTQLNISSFDISNIVNMTQNMLSGLPKLKVLVAGPKCNFKKAYLNKSNGQGTLESIVDPNSKWVNLAGGTLNDAKGKNIWSPEEMMANYNGSTDADTYIRFGVVKAHYQDTQGNKIAEDQDVRGLIGEDYDTVGKKEIPGYTYKGARGEVTGTFDKSTPRAVTYIYTKNPGGPVTPAVKAKVTVHYQDENGNKIASDEVLTGTIGDGYQTMQKTISGYTLKEVRGNATGFFTSNEQTVIYIYNKESNENNITELPNPNNVHKPTRPNKLETNKLKPNRLFKRSIPKARKNNLQPKAINSKTDPLPQTGASKERNGILVALGSMMVLISFVSGAWFKGKKH